MRAFGLLCSLLLTSLSVACEDEELPEILVVRDFELTDQTGERFASDELEGRVWIASFFFTSCTSICPLLTSHVGNLQRRTVDAPGIQFVSVSVDPETDTPERLRDYARRYDADLSRWTFLTGARRDVHELVVEGFRMNMGEREEAEAGYDIPHSGNLLLIDRNGVLRGQYETDQAGLQALERDARQLAAR